MCPLASANTDSCTPSEEWLRPTSVSDHGSIGKLARPSVTTPPRWRSSAPCQAVLCLWMTSQARSSGLLEQFGEVLHDDVGAVLLELVGLPDPVHADDEP